MTKRNPFYEQEKRYRRNMKEMVPKIYAAFALALRHQYGYGQKRILRVLAETQEMWIGQMRGEYDIIGRCYDETGLSMITEVTAKELGIKGDRKI